MIPALQLGSRHRGRRLCVPEAILISPHPIFGRVVLAEKSLKSARQGASLEIDSPDGRPIHPPEQGEIIEFPTAHGLHHYFGAPHEFSGPTGSSFAEFSKLALREFNQRHPEVSLLDDDVWLKFDTVRCPEAPKTGSP